MPFYNTSSSTGGGTPAPTTPPAPKTAAYTFTAADDGVPIQFNAAAAAIVGTLPDPLTVAGRTFIAKKIDATLNAVTITSTAMIDGQSSVMLTDQFAGVIVMAANGTYSIIAQTVP